ncbi:MAG: glutamate--tRNA ligase, partial [Rickettsiales bacterium]|nr:glutamate--tRNA ligase [Rickettsiales bacterium]
MTVVTRFAPSPTGFLHIGGARTALFNWLYAKAHNGQFLLRIEDTDKKRSTQEAIDAINSGMEWLGLVADQNTVYQTANEARHIEVAEQLLAEGKAYYCYCSKEELAEMREKASKEGKRVGYDRRWRDRDASEAPSDVKPVIRIKAPLEGKTIIKDEVQGEVSVDNSELDDFIILRADGTPTYMLAVVVDDHDMNITHVIRGDDHLNNAFRQKVIYDAMDWAMPSQTHIPLIHGNDGAKLSKRHGALGVEAYKDMGFLPEAIRNYLLRLGWSHGDDEIISTKQAIEWFNLTNLGKSPSRFDMKKLENINAHYIKESANDDLLELILPLIEAKTKLSLNEAKTNRILRSMDELKIRAKTLIELAENATFLVTDHDTIASLLQMTDKASKLLKNEGAIIPDLLEQLNQSESWQRDQLEQTIRLFSETRTLKMG